MPQLPMGPEVSARSTRVGADFLSENASADSFGRASGIGMESVGNAVDKLTDAVVTKIKNDRQQAVAAGVAQSDFGPTLQGIRNNMDPSGAGYHDSVANAYDQYVADNADKFADPEARRAYKERMMAQRPSLLSDASTYEATTAAEYSTTQANSALDTLTNRLSNDPGNFDSLVAQGNDVIDARPNIAPTLKAKMKAAWLNQAAFNSFQGRLNAATSTADLDKMAADLADPKQGWMEKFDPNQYQQMLNTIGTAKNTMNTAATTAANAAIDTLNDRNNGLTMIPPEEITAAQQLVAKTTNPITQAKMARIVRDQRIIAESQGLPPAALRQQINQANINPGVAYPNMPAPVSNAINSATMRFGVSASFLGGTIQKEYGGYLSVPKSNANPKFAPQGVSGNVDLSDVNPEVVDAATQAGELFGQPLQVFSGYRSQAKQDAIRYSGDPNRPGVAKSSYHTKGDALDISTAGMDDVTKGKLTDALVNAGFTGIGEYDTHIHADMRAAIPNSYGVQDGKAWGGWTYLSPEVAKTLAAHGFTPGGSSQSIQRSKPVATPQNIDYGLGNVGGTSSAVGVGQFTEETWLGLMHDGSTATRMGLDITGKSDADLLAMRKDPNVSVMMTAAYAEKNKNAMEQVLGRPVTDPELYMAHFLGSGGAIQLLQAVKNNPNASAADLMPKAAAANHNVFYEKDGTARTAQELYDHISIGFVTDPTQVSYGDNQTRTKIADATEKALKDDPMNYASQQSTQVVAPLTDDPASFAARGQSARAVSDYYSIPVHDMKPFTDDEANQLVKAMQSGTAEDTMAVMSRVAGLGGDMAKAGFAQLGEKDPAIGYAGSLAYNAGNVAAATQIIQGEKIIKENPNYKDALGSDLNTKVAQSFNTALGPALAQIDPSQRQAISDAALAYYVADPTNLGAPFDSGKFSDAVQTVMGGKKDTPAVDNVNGVQTVLPPGVDAPTMNAALNRMTTDDWINMSAQKLPPRDQRGQVLDAPTLADEAKLQFTGNGRYLVQLADGGYAMALPNQAYVFTPDPKALTAIANKPDPTAAAPANNTGTSFQFIYDDNGRWSGPNPNAHYGPDGTWYPGITGK